MKKLYALLLILCLLLGSACISASAADTTLISKDIPAEVEIKLQETLDCDAIITIYQMFSCWQGIAENRPIQTIVEEDTTKILYAVFNEQADLSKAVRYFSYQDGTLKEASNGAYASKYYKWLSETASAQYLQINGKILPIQNVYGIKGSIYWQCPVIVYETGDARYYAASLGGFNQPPTYFDEPSFYAYVSAWIADWNETHRLPEGIDNPLEIPAGDEVPEIAVDPFNPLDVTLRKTAVPIWVLPVGITLGVVALGGATAFVIVRKRKKKAATCGAADE